MPELPRAIPMALISSRGVRTLTGRSLLAARVAWLAIVAMTCGLFTLALPDHWQQLAHARTEPQVWMQLAPADEQALVALGLDLPFYATYMMLLELVAVAGFAGLSLLLFGLGGHDRMALLVSVSAVLYGATSVPALQSLAGNHPEWQLLIGWVNSIGWALGLLVFYRFPDARFVPGATRWLAWILMAWALAWPLVPALNPDELAAPLPFVIKVAWYGTGIFAQVHRYQRYATRTEQQQTKWAVFGFVAAFTGFLLFNLVSLPLMSPGGRGLGLVIALLAGYPLFIIIPSLLVPVSLGFACLRSHLWDIDLIINRSLVYAALTGVLGLIYVVTVILFQLLFRSITGFGGSLAVASSTLAIAVLFAPLRTRTQQVIDRRFYRRKHDMERLLATFNARLNYEVDLERLSRDLVILVQETMEPTHVSLWLRSPRRDAYREQSEQKR